MSQNDDRKRIRDIIFITLATLLELSLIFALAKQCSRGSSEYFGKWKRNGEVIIIEDRPGKEVPEVHNLADDKIAKLIRPIRIRGIGSSLHLMVREGLYYIDGDYAIIAFCNICRVYVIFTIKRDGDNLLIGVPEQRDTGLTNGMWHPHHQKLRYSPKKWITYEPYR